jgi:hypothetical protein
VAIAPYGTAIEFKYSIALQDRRVKDVAPYDAITHYKQRT